MKQEEYNVIIERLDEVNKNLKTLIGLLGPLKVISDDVEISKILLKKINKQDNSSTIYTDEKKG
jgi:hypothetical protein